MICFWGIVAAAAVSLASSLYGAYGKAQAEKSQQREAEIRRNLLQQKVSKLENLSRPLNTPVYTKPMLDELLGTQKQILMQGERDALGSVNNYLAARGIGSSGMAEDLIRKTQIGRARNLANKDLQLKMHAIAQNRKAYENYVNMNIGLQHGFQPAIQNYDNSIIGMKGRDPYSDYANWVGKGAMGIAGMLYKQDWMEKQKEALNKNDNWNNTGQSKDSWKEDTILTDSFLGNK